ncbi:hypothetical protein E4U17_002845 [Claviceps sp. LM77 group G4]|nr:hypothetical protein E4U17_002845 [Claviceps sp. LM77 group G4]
MAVVELLQAYAGRRHQASKMLEVEAEINHFYDPEVGRRFRSASLEAGIFEMTVVAVNFARQKANRPTGLHLQGLPVVCEKRITNPSAQKVK